MAMSRRARREAEAEADVEQGRPIKKAKTEPIGAEKQASAKQSGSNRLAVGDSVPDVDLIIQNGDEVNFHKQFGDGYVALFAYPKASTPGCTRQTQGFGGLYEEFQKLGVAIYGISADSPKSQTTFKEKTGVEFDLVSDPQFKLLGPLGAKKPPKSILRSHWVFANGKIFLAENGVKPDASPETVLQFVKKELRLSENDSAPNDEPQAEEVSTQNDAEIDDPEEEEKKSDFNGVESQPVENVVPPTDKKEAVAEGEAAPKANGEAPNAEQDLEAQSQDNTQADTADKVADTEGKLDPTPVRMGIDSTTADSTTEPMKKVNEDEEIASEKKPTTDSDANIVPAESNRK